MLESVQEESLWFMTDTGVVIAHLFSQPCSYATVHLPSSADSQHRILASRLTSSQRLTWL